MFRGRVRHAHFVGVGGIGMSGLAEILRTLEFDVSGSDLKPNEITRRLETMGVRIDIGHRAENVEGADVVVFSSAIVQTNPELMRARALEIPIIPRAEMLAELMRVKYCVTIAGSHGKTTTTSLVSTVLRAAGLDPTVVVGGKVNALGSNARLGAGDLFVAEADESDGSFLRLTPTIAVITNIDAEHLDHYGTHANVKEAFVQFANKIPFYGLGVLCIDHPHVQEILPRVARRHVTYGTSRQADYRASNPRFEGLSTRFDVHRRSEPLGEFAVKMPGAHNVLNALSVIAVADELEIPLNITRDAISSFHGVQRRFTVVGQPSITRDGKRGDVMIVDDYGHHPAEIEATLDAAQRGFQRRVVVAFQPHRYTRTQSLFGDFTRAFNKADVLIVTEVYPAGEAPIEGATGSALTQAIRAHGHHAAEFVGDKKQVTAELLKIVQPGDLVIALGAGDINASARDLAAALAAETGDTVNPSNRRIARPKLPLDVRDLPQARATLPPEDEIAPPPSPPKPPSRVMAAARAIAGGALVVAISGSVAWGARHYVMTTPRFAVTDIAIAGESRRSEDDIATTAGLARGANVFTVDLDRARARLLADPWISEATLARRLPGTILVQITERDAGAIVALGDSYLATRDGEIFKRLEPGDPADLPIITGLSAEAVANDREGIARSIRRALDLASDYEHGPLATRAPLQEIHYAEGGAITLMVGKSAVSLALGDPPFRRKLDQAARVLTELDHRGAKPDAIMLDNDARPERVVVRVR